MSCHSDTFLKVLEVNVRLGRREERHRHPVLRVRVGEKRTKNRFHEGGSVA